MKISVKAFSLACGVLGAVSIFCIGVLAQFGIGAPLVDLIASFYKGFDVTMAGILLGLVYGFIDGLIAGALLAYTYNKFVR